VLSTGIENGQNPIEVARTIRDRFDVSRSRAERIARTEITGALRRARWDEAEDARISIGIRTLEMHLSALSPTTRASHAARHSRLFTVQEVREWYTQDGNSINCYLPNTKVSGRFVAGSKAHYSGTAFKIVTASGRNISITPNHPMMTDHGLLPANKLAKGDNLIAHIGKNENFGWVSDLNSELANPLIENVFASLSNVGHSRTAGVSAVDFYGDGEFINENIEIVDSTRVLTYGINSTSAKLLDNFSLVKTDPVRKGLGALCLGFNRVFVSASSFMSKAGKTHLFGVAGNGKSLQSAFGSSAPFKASIFKPSINGNSRCAAFLAYFKNRFSILNVLSMKLRYVVSAFYSSNILPVGTDRLKEDSDRRLRNSYIVSNSLHAFAGLIALDKIVSIESFSYTGHVYDLQEVSGIMIAQGLISSNCKCSQVSVLVDENNHPLSTRSIDRAKRAKGRYEATAK